MVFRPGKSSSQAIYLARRLQDHAEKSKSWSTLILVDWEKAFDKVRQDNVIETLKRLIVPPKICNLVASFYEGPQFKGNVGQSSSAWTSQRSGIRQGCPLSRYLFVLLKGALFLNLTD